MPPPPTGVKCKIGIMRSKEIDALAESKEVKNRRCSLGQPVVQASVFHFKDPRLLIEVNWPCHMIQMWMQINCAEGISLVYAIIHSS